MALPAIIGGLTQLFPAIAGLVDDVTTSKEEKLEAKAKVIAVYGNVVANALDYEMALVNAKSDIIIAEAKSESWLTRNWRPGTMVIFVGLTVAYWFGWTPDTLPPERVEDMFELIKIGIGGYIAGRSVEKVLPAVVEAFKGEKNK